MCCEKCGANHCRVYTTDDCRVLCRSCFTSEGYNECRNCGKISKSHLHDERCNNYVCQRCFDRYEMTFCNTCGAISNNNYIIDRGTTEEINLCCYCFDSNDDVFWCSVCDRAYSNQHLVYHNENVELHVCSNCSDRFTMCPNCDNIIEIRQSPIINGQVYCHRCAEDMNQPLHRYNFKPEPIFNGDTCNNLYPFMGVELELDNGYSTEACSSCIKDISEDVYCKHDGSLRRGIEIVSHPCTLKYHKNNLVWKNVIAKAREYQFKNIRTCGLHVHINRNFFHESNQDVQDLHIAKIMLLMDYFWDKLVLFSRRDYNSLRRWARKPNISEQNESESSVIEKVKSKRFNEDRYQALNLCNSNTIEFRIFRSTTNYKIFIATLQLVETMCIYAKSHTLREIQSTTWTDLIINTQYQELKSYLRQINLFK